MPDIEPFKPDAPPLAYEVHTPEAREPSSKWSIDELTHYAREQFGQTIEFGRRTAIAIFRAGRALYLIQQKLKAKGAWLQWQEEQHLNRSTVAKAIKFFRAAKSERKIANLTYSAAYKLLCAPPEKSERAKRPRPPVADSDPLEVIDAMLGEWTAAPDQANSEQLDAMERRLQHALDTLHDIKSNRDRSTTEAQP